MRLEAETAELKRLAYELTWRQFRGIPALSPDELMFGPDKLREYIEVMAEAGERDPEKIASAVVCMIRGYEQVRRSKTRVGDKAPLPLHCRALVPPRPDRPHCRSHHR